MRMTELDVWVWEELKKTDNPMFSISELCHRMLKSNYGDTGTSHPLYSRMRYSISKFESMGLLHIYRVVNGGTVFMSKERAK